MQARPRILPTPLQSEIQNPQSEIDDRPHSVYELLTRQMLNDLRSDLDEIRSRVNALLWLTVGAVLLDFIMRLVK